MTDGFWWTLILLTKAVYAAVVWRFFQTIDELELAHNLWSCTIGFYTYMCLLPAWWVLARFGAAEPLDQLSIYLLSALFGTLAYGWRKWRAR